MVFSSIEFRNPTCLHISHRLPVCDKGERAALANIKKTAVSANLLPELQYHNLRLKRNSMTNRYFDSYSREVSRPHIFYPCFPQDDKARMLT